LNNNEKEKLIAAMTKHLPTLRATLGITQKELGDLIGLSRYTIVSIEGGKRAMSWNTFLSLILIFVKNYETDVLLEPLGIYTEELNEFVKLRSGQPAEEKRK